MTTPCMDIFRKDARGNPVWLEAVKDRETAQVRLAAYALSFPGEYFAFDQITRKVVHFELDQIECT